MKTRILLLMLFVASYCFSQSVNDYKAVVIPTKYEFQKTENQYRLQTITKLNLQKAGFQAFYATEPTLAEFPDRCSLLYVEVNKESGFLTSKLFIVFKDCFGGIVYQSPIGKSKEKEFETAYLEALNQAFVSVYDLNYKYNGTTNYSSKSGFVPQQVPVSSAAVIPALATSVPNTEAKISGNNSANLLYAQPTSYGYQLIDSEPKVVMKVYKTSNPASYVAKKGEIQGALISKDNQWFFEYYQNDTLISEKVEVKF
jgi:hypothetical protein